MTPHWLFPKGALTHIVLLIFICFVGLLLVLFGAVPGISRRRACRGNAEHDDRGAGQKETAVHEHGNLPHIQGGVASGDAIVESSPPLNRSKLTLRATGRAAAYDVTKNRDVPAGDHGAHSRPWMPRFADLLQFRPMPSQRNHERGLAGR